MKIIEGMNYRQWQERNREDFNSLAKNQQKEARQQGYYNVGWDQVQNSWRIIRKPDNVVSLFEQKLSNDDIVGAIDLSILEAERAKHLAQQALKSLDRNQQHLDKLADEALAKYQLL